MTPRAQAQRSVRIEAAADFADLFEVKDELAKKGKHLPRGRGRTSSCSAIDARRFVRETWIVGAASAADRRAMGSASRVRLEPHGEWTTRDRRPRRQQLRGRRARRAPMPDGGPRAARSASNTALG